MNVEVRTLKSSVDIWNTTAPSTTVTMTDAESADLIEAVAALKVGRSSPITRKPLAKVIQPGDDGGVDSGYGSASTSQSSTPDSAIAKGAFVDRGTVVNKTRIPFSIPRKKIKLLPFNKPIPVLTQNRFQDLRELYAGDINKLTRGMAKCRGILMSLKVLGADEDSAKPWVFVQCEKAVAAKVRRFFKQPDVDAEFKPANPTTYTPAFEIYVLELPPMELRNDSIPFEPLLDPEDPENLRVFYDLGTFSHTGSLCGVRISASANMSTRSATLGGLVSVLSKEGKSAVLGITAGHILRDEYIEDLANDDFDEEEEFPDDDDLFELDMSCFEGEKEVTHQGQDSTVDLPEAALELIEAAKPALLGQVYKSSQRGIGDMPNLDWALITIDSPTLYLPNIVDNHSVTLPKRKKPIEGARDVVMVTAASGKLSGTLSSGWSYLMLAPGKTMVETKKLTLNAKKVLSPGDSGAWVLDSTTYEVYGHLVACDVFGAGYIIPISSIFEDIKQRTSLQAVDIVLANSPPWSPVQTSPQSRDSPDFALFKPSSVTGSSNTYSESRIDDGITPSPEVDLYPTDTLYEFGDWETSVAMDTSPNLTYQLPHLPGMQPQHFPYDTRSPYTSNYVHVPYQQDYYDPYLPTGALNPHHPQQIIQAPYYPGNTFDYGGIPPPPKFTDSAYASQENSPSASATSSPPTSVPQGSPPPQTYQSQPQLPHEYPNPNLQYPYYGPPGVSHQGGFAAFAQQPQPPPPTVPVYKPTPQNPTYDEAPSGLKKFIKDKFGGKGKKKAAKPEPRAGLGYAVVMSTKDTVQRGAKHDQAGT